ncbi:MAG TPA: beta-ketoacyl-[acyl-carrier-protein] synthase family protein [Phycisphaerales bacterium]|nr:beta-ketoacyl-[acyl-carrier-protein] synthase family protein [Phycisphaerales bacterium]
MSRRVVITGLGAVTGFGVGVAPLWEALLEGRSAIGPITRFDSAGLRCRAAAEAKDFAIKDHVPKHYRKALKVMCRDTELAVAAAKSAIDSAGIVTKALLGEEGGATTYAPERFGCHIGAGLIAAEVPELSAAMATSTDSSGAFNQEKWGTTGMENLTPLWLLKYLPNMLACHVTILHDAQGPSNTITCGEASGLLSIGESVRVIERGAADACFTGGADSRINHMGIVRFDLVGRLAPVHADHAARASELVRPFDPAAKGTILGEGGGILILESLDTAEKRGAKPIAEIVGFGAGHSPLTGDAAERARGLEYAILNALDDAGLQPDAIDAIVPHASGTPTSDEEEESALRAVFGQRLASVPLVTTTPAVGDTMGGAGGIAACVGAMCLKHQTIPARIHAGAPKQGLLAGASPARDAALRHVLVCTNSFAGQNAALVLRRL